MYLIHVHCKVVWGSEIGAYNKRCLFHIVYVVTLSAQCSEGLQGKSDNKGFGHLTI